MQSKCEDMEVLINEENYNWLLLIVYNDDAKIVMLRLTIQGVVNPI